MGAPGGMGPGRPPARRRQTPAPTWVAGRQDQVGWNTGHDTGAGYPAATAPQWGTPGGQVAPGATRRRLPDRRPGVPAARGSR